MINKIRLKLPRFFLTGNETTQLMERVAVFEKATGCELVFHFRKRLGPKPVEANHHLFTKFKLHETKHRSAILITLALKERKFAVWADEGVVRRSGDDLWVKVCKAMSEKLKTGNRLGALKAAIDVAQPPLHVEQPHLEADQENEISNAPIIDDGDSTGDEE